ncbi:hypothetical protein L596_030885 [Steinernema carpocapsae]|uniref:Uncharacterized protein n=1 Tax=Steinernema carpocapsae TaxID=34508 RepID=A0A4U5LNF8_STECR|nr:hypothetical protein L596_030885 [Steinernema carpocapsae]
MLSSFSASAEKEKNILDQATDLPQPSEPQQPSVDQGWFTRMYNSAASWFGYFAGEQAKGPAQPSTSQTAETTSNLSEAAVSVSLSKVKEDAEQYVEGLKHATVEFLEKSQNLSHDAYKNMREHLHNVADSSKDQASAFVATVENKMQGTMDSASEAYEKIASDVEDKFRELNVSAAKKVDEIIDDLNEPFEDKKEDEERHIEDTLKETKQVVDEAVEKAAKLVTEKEKDISEKLSDLAISAEKELDQLAKHPEDRMMELDEDLSDEAQKVYDFTKDTLSNMKDEEDKEKDD